MFGLGVFSKLAVVGGALLAGISGVGMASASTFTSGTLPIPPVSTIGGVVLDLTGLNGNRIITEASASTLFVGSPDSTAYPLNFGHQNGFTSLVLADFGGGLSSASVRVSLYDGDSQAPDFDYHQNTLYVGTTFGTGVNFGDFSDVTTQQTDGSGAALGSLTQGFGDGILDTGFFSTTNATALTSLYSNLVAAAAGSGTLNFYVNDLSPGDQYYDFTQGLDASVVNVGTGPIVTPPPPVSAVPLPASFPMFGAALLAIGVFGYGASRTRAIKAA